MIAWFYNITYLFINMMTDRIMSILTKKWKRSAYVFIQQCAVMGKILYKSILSTSTITRPEKYLKYKYEILLPEIFTIQVQKYLLLGEGELHRNA